MIVLRVLAVAIGFTVTLVVLTSAIRTVVVPRGERVRLTTVVFRGSRRVFRLWADRSDDYRRMDRIMARFAPFTLIALPAVWALLVFVAFAPIYWGLGADDGWREPFVLSGSSLLTLGFARPPSFPSEAAAFAQAFIGLGLVALLISFLPTIYGRFVERERFVTKLETYAGAPPAPSVFLTRANRIDSIRRLDDMWDEAADWFIGLEESHTSFPSLAWFRSTRPEQSWITTAGVVLDTAAIYASTIAVPRTFRAELCLRSGHLALSQIAAHFGVAFNPDPRPTDPISVTKEEFYDLYEALARDGAPLKPDRELAWIDFRGWRVNYDRALIGLAALIVAPPAQWSSDRSLLASPDETRLRRS